jgi:hypothetical protein
VKRATGPAGGALTVNCEDLVVDPSVALIVTVPALRAVTVNVEVALPCATPAADGTVAIDELLLESVTVILPELGAAVSATVPCTC